MRPVGYQLFSSRHFNPLCETLSMIAQNGYSEVEGYSALVSDHRAVDALERNLDKHDLPMPSAHFDFLMVRQDAPYVIDTAARLGIKTVIIPSVHELAKPLTLEDWRRVARIVAEGVAPLKDAGLEVAYHNHIAECATLADGICALDVLLEAEPDLLLQLDIAWILKAGKDPVVWLQRYGDRVISAHLRDIAPPGNQREEDGWADIGHGVLNWPRLWAALDMLAVRHRIVEHGNPADHWRFARRSMETIRSVQTSAWAH